MTWTLYFDKGKRYDYSLKTKEERAQFIEDKLDFILNATPELLMGYSRGKRCSDTKNDRIPKMLDAYTTYLLSSRDAGGTKTEYSFYISERDSKRRKRNQEINNIGRSIDDNSDNSRDELGRSTFDMYQEKMVADSFNSSIEESDNGVTADMLKYAISKGGMSKSDYKKIIAMSIDIICQSKDEELVEMIEQIIFNCLMSAKDELDKQVLDCYVKGDAMRDIADKTGTSKSTVERRLNNMLAWAGHL